MAKISIEAVPKEKRTESERYQVLVDGSVISRHRTKAQARERARQAQGKTPDKMKNAAERAIEAAKVGSPVDATLETMDAGGVDEFAAGSAMPADGPDEDRDPDPWGNVIAMATGSAGNEMEEDDEEKGSPLEFDDPFGLGGGE